MNAEEVELLSDSKYRNYVAAVDKALKNFEYSSEWADLISALGKLNKVMISGRLQPDMLSIGMQRCPGCTTQRSLIEMSWDVIYILKFLTYNSSFTWS